MIRIAATAKGERFTTRTIWELERGALDRVEAMAARPELRPVGRGPWMVRLQLGAESRLSLGIVVGAMMVAYVAVPARLIGLHSARSPRDRLAATAVGGLLGVLVSAPPYLLGRIGLLMIGSPFLRIPGILLFAAGVTLQAGATGAVRAMKMGAKLSGPVSRRPGA